MQPLAVINTISDWETQDVPTLTTNLRAAMKPGQVVLTHDGGGDRSGTLAAVQTVVSERLAAGWPFTLPAGGSDDPGVPTTSLSTGFEDGLGVLGRARQRHRADRRDHHGGGARRRPGGVRLRSHRHWHGLGAPVTGVFQPGRTYQISAWVKLPAGEAGPADVRVSVQRDNAGSSSYDTVATATG